MQGGLNPRLKLDYYENLFSEITRRYPAVYIHSLSVAEIVYIARISKVSIEEALIRLRDAGLQSLPGAGAEILDDEVREEIAYRNGWIDAEMLRQHAETFRKTDYGRYLFELLTAEHQLG